MGDTSPEDRGKVLFHACELIKERERGHRGRARPREQGKTLFEAGLEIHHLIHGLEFYAGLASKVRGDFVPLPQKGAYGMVMRQPIGVCGAIIPWNFPLTLMGTKLGPALARRQHDRHQAGDDHAARDLDLRRADPEGRLRGRQEDAAEGRGQRRDRPGQHGRRGAARSTRACAASRSPARPRSAAT
jgi:hypothetical protein